MEMTSHVPEERVGDLESVIFLGDSDEEADNQELCLTQLEYTVLSQRRDQFLKSETKTLESHQLLIEEELSILRLILARHEGDLSVLQNAFVAHSKALIAGLYLDIIVNDPTQETLWSQFEDFCLEFHHESEQQRNEVFEVLLAKDIPSIVYVHMCYCEHNLSGNYYKARDIISRGIEKHQNALELYTTRLTLEIGECYSMRQDFRPDIALTEEEENILFGNHLFETYEAINSNFVMNDDHVIQTLDNLIHCELKDFPCTPVQQLKLKVSRKWKEKCPEHAVVEVVALDADILRDAVNDNNARNTIALVFNTYWSAFLKHDQNPKILHRAIATFRSMDLNSSTVRKLLYLLLDIGLHHHCLTPEHFSFFFEQLSLENNDVAYEKAKTVYKKILFLNDPDNSVFLWKIRFLELLRFYEKDNKFDLMKFLDKLWATPPAQELINSRNLLPVIACFFSKLINPDNVEISVIKHTFNKLLDKNSVIAKAEICRMKIVWLLTQGKFEDAKTLYIKSMRNQDHSLHSDLLGRLFTFNPVKIEREHQ